MQLLCREFETLAILSLSLCRSMPPYLLKFTRGLVHQQYPVGHSPLAGIPLQRPAREIAILPVKDQAIRDLHHREVIALHHSPVGIYQTYPSLVGGESRKSNFRELEVDGAEGGMEWGLIARTAIVGYLRGELLPPKPLRAQQEELARGKRITS